MTTERDLDVLVTQATDQASQAARAKVEAMELQIQELARLEPARRSEGERRLGEDLSSLVDAVAGTRFENKAVYWLAAWKFRYQADPAAIHVLLDRLAALPSPAAKNLGRNLRVRTFLLESRLEEADRMARPLIAEVPEFAPLRTQIDFHRRLGSAPAPGPGRNLTGGPPDPIRERAEPWLVVAFIQLTDADQRQLLHEMAEELTREAYARHVRLVVVCFDHAPLDALTRFRALPGSEQADLLWANPNPGGDATVWQERWTLPAPLVTVVLGPDRTIAAVDPTLPHLRTLVGLPKESTRPVDSGRRKGFNWKGRSE